MFVCVSFLIQLHNLHIVGRMLTIDHKNILDLLEMWSVLLKHEQNGTRIFAMV